MRRGSSLPCKFHPSLCYFIPYGLSCHLGQTMTNPGQEPYLSPSPNPQSSGRNTIPCSELNNKTTFLPLRFATYTFKSIDVVLLCIFFSIIKGTSVMRKVTFLFSFAALLVEILCWFFPCFRSFGTFWRVLIFWLKNYSFGGIDCPPLPFNYPFLRLL